MRHNGSRRCCAWLAICLVFTLLYPYDGHHGLLRDNSKRLSRTSAQQGTIFAPDGAKLVFYRNSLPGFGHGGLSVGIAGGGTCQKATEAVLQESESLPPGSVPVKGYDFNKGVDFDKLFASFLNHGFQVILPRQSFYVLRGANWDGFGRSEANVNETGYFIGNGSWANK
eukprot:1391441-Amorphochlora_amoeboformis.AAC.1